MINKIEILKEVSYSTARSGGSGGQHVNKVETKVILAFDLNNSVVLSDEQKEIIKARIGHKINTKGIIQIVAQKYASQLKNKNLTNQKFTDLIIYALQPVKIRKKKRTSKNQKEKRMNSKKRRSEVKENRKRVKH